MPYLRPLRGKHPMDDGYTASCFFQQLSALEDTGDAEALQSEKYPAIITKSSVPRTPGVRFW